VGIDLGLGDKGKQYPSLLSEGKKKRVDIVRALARGTPILIADEPLSNLDEAAGDIVKEMLNEHTHR
jgi:ABC-type lipoprotein export system ATPase subunit